MAVTCLCMSEACVCAHLCTLGMLDVLVLVHFKGEADENSTEQWGEGECGGL